MRRAMTAAAVAAMGFASIGLGPVGAQSVGSMTADPSSGPVGAQVLMTGTIDCPGQVADDPVFLYFSDPNAGPLTQAGLGSTPRAGDGTFSKTITVPSEMGVQFGGTAPVEPGTYSIKANCSFSATSTVNTVSTPFTATEGGGTTTTTAPTTTSTTAVTTPTTSGGGGTTPTTGGFTPPPAPPTDAAPMGSAPATAAPGGTIQIDESGFVPGEDVPVVLYSTPTVLATLTASATGQVQGTVTIPAGTTPGTHTLVLYGQSTTKAATITVQAAAAQEPRTLPRTGADPWMPAALVASTVLLLAGAHLVGRSRRLSTR